MILFKHTSHKHLSLDSILLNGLNFTCDKPVRNLGVIFDSSIKFNLHVNKVFKSESFSLYNIRRIRNLITKKACTTLIHAHVISHLDYCNILMTSLPIFFISKLIKIHRQSVHLIYNLPRYLTDSVISLMKDLHCCHQIYLVTRYIFKLLLTTHNVMHHNFPIYLCDLIKIKHIDRSSRFTHKCILETPYHSLKYGSVPFQYRHLHIGINYHGKYAALKMYHHLKPN